MNKLFLCCFSILHYLHLAWLREERGVDLEKKLHVLSQCKVPCKCKDPAFTSVSQKRNWSDSDHRKAPLRCRTYFSSCFLCGVLYIYIYVYIYIIYIYIMHTWTQHITSYCTSCKGKINSNLWNKQFSESDIQLVVKVRIWVCERIV